VLAPERVSLREALASVFVHGRRTWGSLAIIWALLAAIHFATAQNIEPATMNPLSFKAMEALATVSPDEAIPALDHHS
jgi:hypothetical protein